METSATAAATLSIWLQLAQALAVRSDDLCARRCPDLRTGWLPRVQARNGHIVRAGRCRDHHTGFPATSHPRQPREASSTVWSPRSGSPSCCNFAEAMAEGRKAQAAARCRKVRSETIANRFCGYESIEWSAVRLDLDDVVERVSAGETIGRQIIEGTSSASLRHRRIGTGDPRNRAATVYGDGWHRGAVGSDHHARITAKQGQTFIGRMIALVEGAARQRTPNEIAGHPAGWADDHRRFLLAVFDAAVSPSIPAGGQRWSCWWRCWCVSFDHGRFARTVRTINVARDGLRLVQHKRAATSGRGGGRRRRHAAAGRDRHHRPQQASSCRSTLAECRRSPAPSYLGPTNSEGRSIVVLAKGEFGLRARREA